MIDFINDDHKEMHEVLLQRGFTFKQDAKWHSDGAQWEFLYCLGDTSWFIVFNMLSKRVKAVVYSGQESVFVAPAFEPLNGKTFKEVTEYFTKEESPMESELTTRLDCQKPLRESRTIEVITPELLAANRWVKDGVCWISPYKKMTFQFIQLDNEPYYQLSWNGDSRNTCRTSMAKAALGFINGCGLELLQLTYVDVLKGEGFIGENESNTLQRTKNGVTIYIHKNNIQSEVIVENYQDNNFLRAPKNNPTKILQAVKFLEEFA